MCFYCLFTSISVQAKQNIKCSLLNRWFYCLGKNIIGKKVKCRLLWKLGLQRNQNISLVTHIFAYSYDSQESLDFNFREGLTLMAEKCFWWNIETLFKHNVHIQDDISLVTKLLPITTSMQLKFGLLILNCMFIGIIFALGICIFIYRDSLISKV